MQCRDIRWSGCLGWVQIEQQEDFTFWIYKFVKTNIIAFQGEGILGPLVNIPWGPAQMDLRFFLEFIILQMKVILNILLVLELSQVKKIVEILQSIEIRGISELTRLFDWHLKCALLQFNIYNYKAKFSYCQNMRPEFVSSLGN